MTIRTATLSDIPSILSIAQECRLPVIPCQGFLSSSRTAEDYIAFIESSERRHSQFLVYLEDDEVVGYAISSANLAATSGEDTTSSVLAQHYNGDCSLIHEIAVSRSKARQGIGTRLFDAFEAQVIFADTTLCPQNDAGTKFFKKMGFTPFMIWTQKSSGFCKQLSSYRAAA